MGELSAFGNWFSQAAISAANHADANAVVPGALKVHVRKRHVAAGKVCFSLESKFQVLPGFTILRGHSGAGKTTLLRCIAGLSEMEQGSITVGERTLFDAERGINLEPRKRNVAFVFQNLALFPHLSVLENVVYGLQKLEAKERLLRAKTIMESFRIAHLADRLPREVSGGEQQRVALARALVTEPCVLLLDEPLSSLDTRTKACIIADLRAWNQAHGIPILYVTHDYEEVRALGERVITLEHGRIAAQETLPARQVAYFEAGEIGAADVFDAIVVAVLKTDRTVMCRLAGSMIEVRVASAPLELGTRMRVGIRASEAHSAAARAEMTDPCAELSQAART
jgi:molybdate transport system ATP-binding protein